ncbi:MAG: glycosyl transferase family 1 [Flavobacteriales bacterium]|nr:MAG: glycosyl transferase family 1 [Flavobacteriales bacterium]
MKNKVLIITYYWPPYSGPGVQRWLKFVKYFSQFNIMPSVYTPQISDINQLDKSLTIDIPANVDIIKKPIFLFDKIFKLFLPKHYANYNKGFIPSKEKLSIIDKILLFVRGNFFIPDPKLFWAKNSVNFLKNYIISNKIDTIITTGPPHSMHLLGKRLKSLTKVKWLADFRDPWTNIWYNKKFFFTKSTLNKHKKLEKNILNEADHIIVTSNRLNIEYSKLTNKPISTITNGFDHFNYDDFNLDTKFSISHIGTMLSDRNPYILWKVLSRLINEVNDLKHHLQLNLVGNVSVEVKQSIKKHSLEPYVQYIGHISYDQTSKYLKNSQILLLIQTNKVESNYIIPAKLFEYLNSSRPIISISNNDDVESIINDTNVGFNFKYDQEIELYNCILNYFEKFKADGISILPNNTNKYNRIELTRSISNIIKNL